MHSMPSQGGLRRLSGWVSALAAVLGLGALAFALWRWMRLGAGAGVGPGWALLPPATVQAGVTQVPPVPLPWQWAGLALECLPLSALGWALWSMHRICAAVLAGPLFSVALVRAFRSLAWALVGVAVSSVVYDTGVTALLSWLASGQHGGLLSVGISSVTLGVLLIGLMMFMTAHVLDEGCRLQAEVEQFV